MQLKDQLNVVMHMLFVVKKVDKRVCAIELSCPRHFGMDAEIQRPGMAIPGIIAT
jgi:hypothetical protein